MANLTNKQRAYLTGLSSNLNPIFQSGKASLTPENVAAISEAIEKRAQQSANDAVQAIEPKQQKSEQSRAEKP